MYATKFFYIVGPTSEKISRNEDMLLFVYCMICFGTCLTKYSDEQDPPLTVTHAMFGIKDLQGFTLVLIEINIVNFLPSVCEFLVFMIIDFG